MGYRVSSILLIPPNDKHCAFVYYVPTYSVRYSWINDAVYDAFELVASRLGPRAVLIGPHKDNPYAYSDSLTQVFMEGEARANRDWRSSFLHVGLPFLIGTRRPLSVEDPPEMTDLAAINLAAFKDADSIRGLLDLIIAATRTGRDLVEDLPRIERQAHQVVKAYDDDEILDEDDWSFVFEKALELKPNVFGLGLNLNAVATWLRLKLKSRRS
ncbi:hypothetical protein [Allorhizocola rhizosphaerae]|uniref:hypothetical protein n=1 Tax=Allorhizocola rhizosphaerae TaxID=1872709 RepID=UPI0013C3635E|nr:hypothetical protein [Allorhizocola rhizosphaerae]